jgi:hypothetical protein
MTKLAEEIHNAVYSQFVDYKTTIFLCGAGESVPNSIRSQIDKELSRGWFSYRYDLFYPEVLFAELLTGPGHQDLISLENMLAESVDAVVLVVESWGAVAELGSFSSNDKLRKKLICVVDQRYKKSKSFINYGPLRLLRSKKEGIILYGDFNNIGELISPIRKAIRKIEKGTTKSLGVENVVQAHRYILSSIYLLEPVSRPILTDLVMDASNNERNKAEALTAGALSILIKNEEVQRSTDGYILTAKGVDEIRTLGRRGTTRSTFDLKAMDAIRINVLNWKLRNKKLPYQ